MRVIIVDDEAPARARMRRLLAAFPDVEVVGEAADGEAALAAVDALRPDAMFVDIQMPGVGGLDVAASLPDPAPAVVFVTAYDAYALQAFDAAAVDYLLKPVEPARLARSLERVRGRGIARGSGPMTGSAPASAPARLLIPDRGRTHVVPVVDIVWLEAADNYVVVHTAQHAPLLRRTLAALLADLGPGFARTHRGAAVAIARVRGVHSGPSGDGVVRLTDGQQAPLSRQHRATLRALLAGAAGNGDLRGEAVPYDPSPD